jgi:hypothetical protein
VTTPNPPAGPPPDRPGASSDAPGIEPAASLAEQVGAALDVCDDLLSVLPALVDRIAALEAAASPGEPGETRSDYRFESYPQPGSDGERAAQVGQVDKAWTRLANWVDWLVGVFRLSNVIPECWPLHPVLVEELVSLRVSWVGAWQDSAHPDAPAGWMRRLYDTKQRLTDGNWGVPRCNGRHHPSGLDNPDMFAAWFNKPTREQALAEERELVLDILGAPMAIRLNRTARKPAVRPASHQGGRD